jgi:Carbohydrate esterase, sialic acid-specific acetylesterase
MIGHSTIARRLIGVAALLPLAFASATTQAAPELVHLLIVAGQSNAVGYGADASQLPARLFRPQRDILYRYEIGGIAPGNDFSSLHWLPGDGTTIFPQFFGPELSLGRFVANVSPGLQIAVVKVAFSSTSLAFDWDPNRNGSLFDTLAAMVADVMADLAANGKAGKVDGVFWMQGEADANNQSWANAYQSNLAAFMAACRNTFAAPQMPFILGRINAANPNTYRDIVRAAQVAAADADPNADWVDTDALPLYTDHIHFTADGELRLGREMAVAFLRVAPRDAAPDGDTLAAILGLPGIAPR